MIPGVCWRCEEPGHAAAYCDRPPPKTKKELAARIDRYIERWQEFKITRAQKRDWIAAESKSFEKARAA